MSPLIILLTLALGSVAGALGTLLGLGGGVFLVPFLVLVVGLPFQAAAAVSLTTVIATSSVVSAAASGRQLINLRLGMLLEVATAAGGIAGGLTAQALAPRTLQITFAVVAIAIGLVTLARASHSNVLLEDDADPGPYGGRYFDDRRGRLVAYRIRRLPLAIVASAAAGNVATLLGIGGGVVKVPVLTSWCGMPMRAAAATSAFMIGVTATTGAVIYYGAGNLVPELAAAGVLGVQVGSTVAGRAAVRLHPRWLKTLMALVLFTVAALMLVRSS